MSMNLANLLNDGKLKKSFMVATLASTVMATFTTAATLHDKVQEKRFQAKQKKLDSSQDERIQALENQVKNGEGQGERDSKSQSSRRSQSKRRRRRSMDDDEDSDDFDRNARRSQALIAREYDENVRRLGPKYAQGDVIAENRLQAQIITMQQTVIDVLQDALMNGRSLTKADIRRLIAAQDQARDGSLDALRDQYQRMLPAAEQRRASLQPARQVTLPAPPPEDNGLAPVRRVTTLPANYYDDDDSPTRQWCRYAFDLQNNFRRPLHPSFSTGGSQRCPACSVLIPVTANGVFIIENRTPLPAHQQDAQGGLVEVREYTMESRMVVKSHTPSGDFVCVLCYRDRERSADCYCASVQGLVTHLQRDHTREEFEREEDIYLSRG